VLFATDLTHASSGFSDIDSNQLTTPEFTVTDTENFLRLQLYVPQEVQHAVRLNIYIVNELNHRIPDRLYSKNLDERGPVTVGCCFTKICLVCYGHLSRSRKQEGTQ